MRLVLRSLLPLILLLVAFSAQAHESRPLYVEIREKAPNIFTVTWKIPPSALSVTVTSSKLMAERSIGTPLITAISAFPSARCTDRHHQRAGCAA